MGRFDQRAPLANRHKPWAWIAVGLNFVISTPVILNGGYIYTVVCIISKILGTKRGAFDTHLFSRGFLGIWSNTLIYPEWVEFIARIVCTCFARVANVAHVKIFTYSAGHIVCAWSASKDCEDCVSAGFAPHNSMRSTDTVKSI